MQLSMMKIPIALVESTHLTELFCHSLCIWFQYERSLWGSAKHIDNYTTDLVCILDIVFSMKFLEYTRLNRISDFLSHLNLGERTIKGFLEAYSCKHTGTDKKLSISLENEILDYIGKSYDTDSSSPAEYLMSRSSRKTLTYLILTLYHMYPDYDFSAVKAHQFFAEESWDSFEQIFDTYMFEASKEWIEASDSSSLLEDLYKALDEVIKLAECEIYSYNPDCDADPFVGRGVIWSFNFFFYNRKLKRVVSFCFCCLSNLAADDFLTEESSFGDNEEIFDSMDM
ncbi:hypothetical protein Nepgr_017024 [Nepenthes gracilis]|uniref:Repressor of RNA polymerase III transcription n=1 Tax=Nepenthes gracilis TaxID=150966 RepID=A0AAD3SNP2_NEPGR|nr:hypothetical protein Nepgr_017024 [Nepenthes gracilis]